MIEFQQVTKKYRAHGGGDVLALDNISFNIGGGELVFLAGPSGAGKSTLMKLISGLEQPTSGSVILNGQSMTGLKPKNYAYLRRRLGILIQGQSLLDDRTVLMNVMLPLIIEGETYKDAETRALKALERLNMIDKRDALPPALSGGEQQRVAIARAIVNRPQIILADEPTAYLDHENAAVVVNALKAFQRSGVTCIISSHDQQFLEQASRVIYLSRGTLADSWTASIAA